MTRRKRRNHSSAFKAKVALAAVKGERTLAELARVGISKHRSSLDCWYRPGLYPDVEGRERGLESQGRRRLTGLGCQADVPSAEGLQPCSRSDSCAPLTREMNETVLRPPPVGHTLTSMS
jgi:hypothetical protein